MGTVSTTLPSDGQTIDAADVNTPINAIITQVNGNIDADNITDGSVTPAKRTNGFFVVEHVFGSGTGSKSITGVGFKPKAVIVLGRERGSGTELVNSKGMAAEQDGVIAQNYECGYGSTAGPVFVTFEGTDKTFVASNSTVQFAAGVTSFDADGITVDVTTGTATAQFHTFKILFLG